VNININKLQQKSLLNRMKSPMEELRRPLEPEDKVEISAKDKTEDGKIPLIISSQDREKLLEMKKEIAGEKGLINDELPIISGFTAEVDDMALTNLLTLKREGVNIYIDEKNKMIDDPVIIDKSPGNSRTDNAIKTLGIDKLWEQGLTGEGVTIAVLDTGIYPHKDFEGRIIAFKDYVNGYKEPYDDQGHGTHVAGDCAGDGTMSDGKFKGPAPSAKLVGVKTLDKHGAGRFSDIIKGIQWTVENKEKYNIKVMNMSLGGPSFQSYKDDPICQAVEKALEKGIIPVIAAGNSGPKAFTVGSPGNDPNVLTVGAFDDKNTVERYDDEIAKFSSRGPTKIDNLTKPDILSPGVNITAPTAYGSVLDKYEGIPHEGEHYITISGTSMATPVMAGIVADIIQANPNLSPREVKEIFTTTAMKLPGLDANQQGSGVVQVKEALEKALAMKEANQ